MSTRRWSGSGTATWWRASRTQGSKGERLAGARVGPGEPFRVNSRILRTDYRRLASLLVEREGRLEVRGTRTSDAIIALGACSGCCAGEVGEVYGVQTVARRPSTCEGYCNWHAMTAVHIHPVRISLTAHYDLLLFDGTVSKCPLLVGTTL